MNLIYEDYAYRTGNVFVTHTVIKNVTNPKKVSLYNVITFGGITDKGKFVEGTEILYMNHEGERSKVVSYDTKCHAEKIIEITKNAEVYFKSEE